MSDYTIPSDNRELQRPTRTKAVRSIIPYQVITGNYNQSVPPEHSGDIIPYQVITGNYNFNRTHSAWIIIIPYQVITGNYNACVLRTLGVELYHTK